MKGLFLGVLTLGVVVIVTYQLINKKQSKITKKDDVKSSITNRETAPLPNEPAVKNDKDIVDPKTHAAAIISERHVEANTIITSAISNILNEDNKKEVVISENESAFKDMFSDLDKLSK